MEFRVPPRFITVRGPCAVLDGSGRGGFVKHDCRCCSELIGERLASSVSAQVVPPSGSSSWGILSPCYLRF